VIWVSLTRTDFLPTLLSFSASACSHCFWFFFSSRFKVVTPAPIPESFSYEKPFLWVVWTNFSIVSPSSFNMVTNRWPWPIVLFPFGHLCIPPFFMSLIMWFLKSISPCVPCREWKPCFEPLQVFLLIGASPICNFQLFYYFSPSFSKQCDVVLLSEFHRDVVPQVRPWSIVQSSLAFAHPFRDLNPRGSLFRQLVFFFDQYPSITRREWRSILPPSRVRRTLILLSPIISIFLSV